MKIFILEFGEDSFLSNSKAFVERHCFGTLEDAQEAASKYVGINTPDVLVYDLNSRETIEIVNTKAGWTGDCPSCGSWMDNGYCQSCGMDNG